MQLADVTGDGLLDVVASAMADLNGVVDAGALYVYAGGALQTPWPSATLSVPGAVAGDEMFFMLVADVTGDGIPDVLGGAPDADFLRQAGRHALHAQGNVLDAGALYLFPGSPGMQGDQIPTTLAVPNAHARDRLGS